jgi:outer membrane protein assembly factor BamB
MLIMLCLGTLTFAIKIQSTRGAGTIQEAQADWWPMFHHDLTHTGNSSSTAPSTNQTLWSFNTGGAVVSSPTIADGVVYIGSMNDNFYALNASTGTLIWNYTTGNSIVFSSAAVANGIAYVGSEDGDVYAFNASTGTLIWNCKVGELVWSSPAVANGMVYIGSEISNVDALNASNGDLVWSYSTGDEVVSSPAIDNGVIFIGSLNGNVYALNATDGTYMWSYQTGSYVTSSPAVTNGVVYISTDGCGSVEKDSDTYALNASTGALLWSYPTGDFSSPAVANGLVFAGGSDEKLYALNATTGACVWNYLTGEPSSPAVAGGLVFIGDANWCAVHALNASTGAPLWSYQTGGSVSSSPAVCGGVVFIGSDDGKVYAFGSSADPPSTSSTSSTSPLGWGSPPPTPGAPVYFSVEPVAVDPLTNLNASINGLEVPSSPSPVGRDFTVEIHLRNATATNVPAGVAGVLVDFDFANILNYCKPIGFTTMLGQSGGAPTGYFLYALNGFYDANGNPVDTAGYVQATQYAVCAATTATTGWNNDDGLVAQITFQITGQPLKALNQTDFYSQLHITFAELTDNNSQEIPYQVVQGTLEIDDPARIPGDINGDGKVNLQDLVLFADAYRSRPGDARWSPNADLKGDGVVDLADLTLFAHYYGYG